MKQNKDRIIKDFKIGIIFLILSLLVLSVYGGYKGIEVERLEQDLELCQDKVPEELREVNITIESFDKIKLKVWCWSKGYPNFDGNDSRIWEIVKNCEVRE
ncbi:hypothetical protein LCGC14_0462050 [marine sediment metagenome]|uniref:Uncharacterized protein n=1 Tax=marine sediment metagenome TaxID=412755 RepID=A0A0F9V1F6_9ZZZZ